MGRYGSKPRISAAAVRLVFAGLLLAASLVYLHSRSAEEYTLQVIPPTCTESGYTLATSTRTGGTDVRDVVPATGHQYGDWTFVREGTAVEPKWLSRFCTVCGWEEEKPMYPDVGLDRLALNGDFTGIGKRDEVPVEADLLGAESFSCYAMLKHQGHSSLAYDKKNYTLKLYRDPERTEKQKLSLSHWNPENKYILKANYQDSSQCRNLVCADIWAGMVSSREFLPVQLRGLSNYGAVDGFPVALYENGDFRGLYTLNLHKDDDLFGMKDGREQAIMILNHTEGEEAFFREEARFGEDTPWEVEYCGTADQGWAKERLNELIRFVQTSDDAAFREELPRYLDVDSAVDYLIAMYALGLTEHCAKDLVLVSYGRSEPWICSMYDMEEAFDLEGPMPVRNGERWDSGTGSLLWDRFLNAYPEEIRTRYVQLRQSVLETETLCGAVEAFVAQIPEQLYQADAEIYGTPVHNEGKTREMTENIRSLTEKLDEILRM